MGAGSPIPSNTVGDLSDVQSFSNEEKRIRLTPTAIEAVMLVAKAWSLTDEEASALLGVSASAWRRINSGSWKGPFSQDQLFRASAIICIFCGLHVLFADDMADRWPRLPNKGSLFEDRTPIATMIEGGIPLMLNVRQHVEALRAGF